MCIIHVVTKKTIKKKEKKKKKKKEKQQQQQQKKNKKKTCLHFSIALRGYEFWFLTTSACFALSRILI